MFCSTVRESLLGPKAPSSDLPPLAVYEYPPIDEDTQVDEEEFEIQETFEDARGKFEEKVREDERQWRQYEDRMVVDGVERERVEKRKKKRNVTVTVRAKRKVWCLFS